MELIIRKDGSVWGVIESVEIPADFLHPAGQYTCTIATHGLASPEAHREKVIAYYDPKVSSWREI